MNGMPRSGGLKLNEMVTVLDEVVYFTESLVHEGSHSDSHCGEEELVIWLSVMI